MRCEARIALPAISARKAAATSIWPRWPRSAWMRGSNGVSEPRAASVDSAPVTSAAWNTRSISNRPAKRQRGRELRAVEQRQPFLGAEHDRREAGARQRRRRRACARRQARTSPTPIIAAVMWASGARSPDAPTEPWHGTTGITLARQHGFEHVEASRSRTPEAPRPRLASFSAIISRTVARAHRLADARGVREHDVALERREVGGRRCARWPACRSRC